MYVYIIDIELEKILKIKNATILIFAISFLFWLMLEQSHID